MLEVPREADGMLPSQANPPLQYPSSLEAFLVAGNESLPSGGVNAWNKERSLALLRFYGEEEHTDTKEENNERSRARRLKLARKLGITNTQLNFAQLSL